MSFLDLESELRDSLDDGPDVNATDQPPIDTIISIMSHLKTPLYIDGPEPLQSRTQCRRCDPEEEEIPIPRNSNSNEASLKELAARVVEQHTHWPTPLTAAVFAATRDIHMAQMMLEPYKARGVVGGLRARLYVTNDDDTHVLYVGCLNNGGYYIQVDTVGMKVVGGRVPDFSPMLCHHQQQALVNNFSFYDTDEERAAKDAKYDDIQKRQRQCVSALRQGIRGYTVSRSVEGVVMVLFPIYPEFYIEIASTQEGTYCSRQECIRAFGR
jgi:hypothetical protein